jgi:molybdopterin/thiamine biosynthesis adenylyltransferase/rhodanese-related sulfurtransferase
MVSKEELQRYSRQMNLPQWSTTEQEKLKASRVLIVGAGALGTPVVSYLAAAGVGHIGIIDNDRVELSNIHRQVLYKTNDIGLLKVHCLASYIQGVNPYVAVQLFKQRLTVKNAFEIAEDYDIIVDGTDNFPTRYLVNDLCVLKGKTNVHGSINQFTGQIAVFNTEMQDGSRSPNYRDLYPNPPKPEDVQSCEEGGILGPIAGVVGSMMAMETLKIASGIGTNLHGKLLHLDLLLNQNHTFSFTANKDNPLTGEHPSQKKLIDYEMFCGIKNELKMKEITVQELDQKMKDNADFVLIDVREEHEFEQANMGGKLIPLGQIPERFAEIPKDKDVVVHCRMGSRSANAIMYLMQAQGYDNLSNLAGGITAWANEIDPSLNV